jgi:hypothetical protein
LCYQFGFILASKQVLSDTDVNGATALHHVSISKSLQSVSFLSRPTNDWFFVYLMRVMFMVFAGNYIRKLRHCSMAQVAFQGIEDA